MYRCSNCGVTTQHDHEGNGCHACGTGTMRREPAEQGMNLLKSYKEAVVAPAVEGVLEAAAKALDSQQQGGHCGESTSEIIVRQRRNAIFREAAEIVRARKQ